MKTPYSISYIYFHPSEVNHSDNGQHIYAGWDSINQSYFNLIHNCFLPYWPVVRGSYRLLYIYIYVCVCVCVCVCVVWWASGLASDWRRHDFHATYNTLMMNIGCKRGQIFPLYNRNILHWINILAFGIHIMYNHASVIKYIITSYTILATKQTQRSNPIVNYVITF